MAEPVAVSALPARIGRYDVVGYIATGGMAELFLGKDPETRRPVVIKRVLPHLARQPAFVSMFVDEARIGSLVHHPNLVEIYELGQVGTDLFLVMEYLEGENLLGLIRRLVARDEDLAYGLAAHLVAQACLGLAAAHELCDEVTGKPLRIVHRDVSPHNVFLCYDGAVKVLDFGIATAAHRLSKTSTGQLKGKFSYMSPEQCRGETLDARSDIFSLGVVLYELSTRKRLFSRATELLMLKAVCEDPIPRPSRARPDYPRALEDICMRALARERGRRFASARDMHDALVASTVMRHDYARAELATTMRTLFDERITQKRELVRLVRANSKIELLPAVEVDESVDVPQASTDSERSDGARGRMWIVAALLVVLAGGGAAAAWWYADREDALAVESPPTAAARPHPVPPPISVPTPPPVSIDLETVPSGAKVVIAGTARGTTPLSITLPRGGAAQLELALDGYEPLVRALDLDRDQRLELALVKAGPPIKPPPPKPKAAEPKPDDNGFHRFD